VRRIIGLTLAGLALSGAPALEAAVLAPSLRGSPAAMQQQNRVAKEHGLPFYRTAQEIREAVTRGDLVELRGNEDYAVADFVRLPYVQPEVLMFVERLSAQYRASCGQRLVVTSAVRPSNGQPSNAHALSVHPAGMALDLRVSDRASCRSWLEGTLLSLERRGVLNGIREFRPPHYHVAVFPGQYRAYVEERLAIEARQGAGAAATAPVASALADLPLASGLVAAGGGGDGEADAREPGLASWAGGLVLAAIALPFGIRVARSRLRRS
jgi:hypothetical protein